MDNLKVGFAKANANPPLGIGVHGYYVFREAKGILDDIEVVTMVLNCKDKTIALISIDNCGISKEVLDEYKEMIEKETGVSKDKIFISATHTHTGPYVEVNDLFLGDKVEETHQYRVFLGERVLDSVKLALADIKPAKMGYIVGYAPERVAYIRRYKMKDGTTMTCPPINDPNIDYPIGTLDQRVNVLRFDREGAESIVLVNYGLHADTINGEMLSADWPYWMGKTLEKALDGVKTIFFNGAEGDVGSTHVYPTEGDMNDTEISFDNEMKSPGMARFVGRAIAGTVLQVYDKAYFVDVDDIDIFHKDVVVPSNMPKKEDMPLAKKYKELHDSGHDDQIPYTAMELTTVVAEALRMCRMEHGPESYTINLVGVKLGPVAMVGIPGEPFTDIGVGIKEAEGWGMIMPCSLANGNMGYFPMKSAYDEGGYEARTSPFKAGVAERIIEGGKALLDEMRK